MKPMMPEQKKHEPDEYELNSNLDTLHKAHKIAQDPKMMKHLHKHAKGKMKALAMYKNAPDDESAEGEKVTSIKDIRRKANKTLEIEEEQEQS